MTTNCSTRRNAGFTLVELLVVISIIGILAGALFMIINPVEMQRKGKEAVLNAKTSQLCLALDSCAAAKDIISSCDSISKLGAADPAGDPPTSTYTVSSDGTTVTVTGTLSSCSYTCNANFSTGDIGKFTKGANCL
jgi:prepilin-type N-terminal cleavage/methylation domain-containing protein